MGVSVQFSVSLKFGVNGLFLFSLGWMGCICLVRGEACYLGVDNRSVSVGKCKTVLNHGWHNKTHHRPFGTTNWSGYGSVGFSDARLVLETNPYFGLRLNYGSGSVVFGQHFNSRFRPCFAEWNRFIDQRARLTCFEPALSPKFNTVSSVSGRVRFSCPALVLPIPVWLWLSILSPNYYYLPKKTREAKKWEFS